MRSAGFTVQIDAIRSALSFIGIDSDASITLYYYRLRVRSAPGLAVSRNRECAYFSLARLYKRLAVTAALAGAYAINQNGTV